MILQGNRTIKRRDYTSTTRLWGLCEDCRCTWQWNGLTANVEIGLDMLLHSGCLCERAANR